MEAQIFGEVWNDYMWPTIQSDLPIFLAVGLIFLVIGWRRTETGVLLFTLTSSVWVAKIFMEDIGLDRAGAPGVFLTFMLVALIVNGVLLFRVVTTG